MKALILGGTGTLGRAIAKRIYPFAKLTIFSRDELKQKQMSLEYPAAEFVLGDIRDRLSVEHAVAGQDFVFHFAALKHIDIVEKNQEEGFKTNVLGTMNAAKAAVKHNVSKFVFSSTDKAVLPINSYGMGKALSERYLWELNRKHKTYFMVYRWGNVLCSRGSAVPIFAETLKEGYINLTHPDMTRFFITVDRAANFMIDNFSNSSQIVKDKPFIPEMKACKITDLAQAVADVLGIASYETKIIGVRPGEKIHECLYSSHDFCLRSDTCEQYTYDELHSLVEEALELPR